MTTPPAVPPRPAAGDSAETLRSPAWRAAAVLAGDLGRYSVFWVPVMVAALVVFTVVADRAGGVDGSVWQGVQGIVRWVLVVGGAMVARNYLSLFVANGIARRDALVGMWPVLVALAVVLGMVSAGVFAVEGLVFDAFGWPHVLAEGGDRFVYDAPDQYGLIIPATAAGFLGYLAGGALIGAAFARGSGTGLLLLPVAAIPLILAELLVGQAWPDGWRDVLADLRLSVVAGVALAVAVSVVAMAAASWLLRDLPLDNDRTAWWR